VIILLTGANDFAVRQTLDAIVAKFLDKHGAHALERWDGESVDLNALPDLMQGGSLFAPQRLVVIRDAAKNKPLWEAIGDWVERVPDEVTLILLEQTADKRTRTYKQLQKHGQVKDLPELNEHELAKWAQSEAKKAGSQLDGRTAMYLVAQAGTSQWALYNEVQKLSNYPEITKELVDELVEPAPQASAFELLDNVLGGNNEKATKLLERLKTVEDPYKLFGLLVSQIQTLALVVTAAGKSPDAIAKEAGIHPFVVKKMQPLTRSINYARLQSILAAVAQADSQMKSTGVDPWVLLAQCLGKIASRS
jgi:DNA polymerase-3 subunit delta